MLLALPAPPPFDPGTAESDGDEPAALASGLPDGRFDGFGVAESERGRSVVRGVAAGAGAGFGGGVIFGVGVGVGFGVAVGRGVGVACGWEGLGFSDGLARVATPAPSPSAWSVAKAGAPRMAVTRMATASDADLARARINIV